MVLIHTKQLNPKYQSKEVREQRNIVLNNAHHEFTPLIGYAHNDWLERLSEFGLIGSWAVFYIFVHDFFIACEWKIIKLRKF